MITEQIREALRKQPLPAGEIARLAGVDPASLSHFLSGQRGLYLETVERLAPFIGLQVTVNPPSASGLPDDLITREQFAQEAGIGMDTLRKWITKGKVTTYRTGIDGRVSYLSRRDIRPKYARD